MIRVTHNILKDDAVYNIKKHQSKMSELQNNLSTGKKVQHPHQDPVAATHSMLYRTRITELRQFMKNIDEGRARMNVTEGAIRSSVDIFHRMEELTVQAAHGIYTQDDRAKIAVEIDELLKEMLSIANTKFKGESLFSGHQFDKTPFEALTSRPDYADREVITQVKYNGDIGKQNREIEQEEYASVNLAGNSIFWASNDQVLGSATVADSTDPSNIVSQFTADKNYVIRIDNREIQIMNGDDILTIRDKINAAKLPVQADIINGRFAVKNTTPRQLWLEDIQGGNLLQQLGIKDAGQMPNEVSANAQRQGRSVFDVMIKLRDDLWQNNVRSIGSEDLGYIHGALDNVLTQVAELGARSKRFETVMKRMSQDELDMTDILAKTENIDIAKVVMDLQMLESVHRSALATAAKVLRPTLMDFLR